MVEMDRRASPPGMAETPGRWYRRFRLQLRPEEHQFSELWMAVILLAVMDVGLTFLGLQNGFVELNPLAQHGLAVWGLWTLFIGKALAIAIGAFSARTLDRKRFVVPMVFVVIWGVVVATNAHLLVTNL